MLSDTAQPTEDIYFMGSVASWFADQGVEINEINVRRRAVPPMSRSRFSRLVSGAQVLVCRSLPLKWIELLESERTWSALYYLIDDDFAAAVNDQGLPPVYRRRLARVVEDHQPRLLALASEVVATSQHLFEALSKAHRNVQLLTPPWLSQPSTLEHFADRDWTFGFHGTRVHLPDLEHIGPAIESIHQARTDVRFEIMLGQHTPNPLRSMTRVLTPRALPWLAFRRYQMMRRIQVGLVPLWDTPFNRGKSFIKFLDVAAMGGVGIFSDREPYRSIVCHGTDGLLVQDEPDAWKEAMLALLENRDKARWMAKKAMDKAEEIGHRQHARRFWQQRMRFNGVDSAPLLTAKFYP